MPWRFRGLPWSVQENAWIPLLDSVLGYICSWSRVIKWLKNQSVNPLSEYSTQHAFLPIVFNALTESYVEWLALLLRTRAVSCSNLGPQTDRLFPPRPLILFLSPAKQILGQWLKIGHGRFLSQSLTTILLQDAVEIIAYVRFKKRR
jgi:hypothetical protein